jgi:hypothetical protein
LGAGVPSAYGDDSLGDVAVFEVDVSGQLRFAVDVLGHDLTAAIGSLLNARGLFSGAPMTAP